VEAAVGALLGREQDLVDVLQGDQQRQLAGLLAVLLRGLTDRAAGTRPT
jgi:hypothetical protein